MNKTIIQNSITMLLNQFLTVCKDCGKTNRNDNYIDAECFLEEFINELKDWELNNANIIKSNMPGIDLIDEVNKKIIQISSKNTTEKINHSINEICENGTLKKDFHNYEIYFFFIKKNSISLRNKEYNFPKDLHFDSKNNIWCIDTLLNEVNAITSIDKLLELEKIALSHIDLNYIKEHNKYKKYTEKKIYKGNCLYGDKDSYILLNQIGVGATGVVCKAVSSKNKLCAIKFCYLQDLRHYIILESNKEVHTPKTEFVQWNETFKLSSESMLNIEHENIAKVIDIIQDEFYLPIKCVMEYVEGTNLDSFIDENPLSEQEAVLIIKQIGSALKCLHDNNIIHLDVKPSNIIYNKSVSTAKLIDFTTAINLNKLDTAKYCWLTKDYAPNWILHADKLDISKLDFSLDIYSLGITLYQLVTNKMPPMDSFNLNFMNIVLQEMKIDEEITRVIKKAIHFSPKERYNNICEFLDDLPATHLLSNIAKYKPLSYEELRNKIKYGPFISASAAIEVELP